MSASSRKAALLFATCASLLVTAGPALAQQSVLRYTTGAPPKTPWVAHLDRFAADVDEVGKGTVKIDKFIAAQLGNEQDTLQQVARGRIDMGGFSMSAIALLVPEAALTQMPFYFKSVAEQDCVLDNHVQAHMTKRLAERGIRFLNWTAVGAAEVIGKKPYVLPSEVRGLKAAAAQTRVSAMMWQTLGANANPLGITEIAGAFQTGLVDLQAQVVSFYVPSGLSKVAPVMTQLTLSETGGIIAINQAVYDKLPADHRAVIDQSVGKRSAATMRADVRGFEGVLRDMHVKGGGQLVVPSPEQRDAWRKALEPAWPDMVKDVGSEGPAFFALMEKGRAACSK